MANHPLSKTDAQAAIDAVHTHGGIEQAAVALKIPRGTMKDRAAVAKRLGLTPRGMAPDHPRILKGTIQELRGELKKAQQTSTEIEALKEAVGTLRSEVEKCAPPKWTNEALVKPSSPGVPTLLLSDFHWGEIVFPAQIGNVNKFNMKIARERLRYTIETAIHLCRIISPKMDYPGIVAPLGGDMISGNIHDELTATNELNTMPVVIELYGELIGAITKLRDTLARSSCHASPATMGATPVKSGAKIVTTRRSTGYSIVSSPNTSRMTSALRSTFPIAPMLYTEYGITNFCCRTATSFAAVIVSSAPLGRSLAATRKSAHAISRSAWDTIRCSSATGTNIFTPAR